MKICYQLSAIGVPVRRSIRGLISAWRCLPALVFLLAGTGGTLRSAEVEPVAEEQPAAGQAHVIVVVGAGGERKYGEMFATWAMRVQDGARRAGAKCTTIGLNDSGAQGELETLRETLTDADHESTEDLWLVLIGHGTYTSKAAKFNLRGKDLDAVQLAEWLEQFTRRVAVINCSSCSAPFLDRLKGPNRVIVSATKSGNEITFTRFGDYFTTGLAGEGADLDKDEQVSLLELFITASKSVYAYYEQEGQLATEHALLDDNGDGKGSRAEWFKGVRAVKKVTGGGSVDGYRAHQIHLVRSEFEKKLSPELRAERDRLEMSLNRHRDRKQRMKEDLYYAQLEKILVQIGRIYQQAEARLAAGKKAAASTPGKGKKSGIPSAAPKRLESRPPAPAAKAEPAPDKLAPNKAATKAKTIPPPDK